MTTRPAANPTDASAAARKRPAHAIVAPTARTDDQQGLLAEFLAAGNLDEVIPKLARDRRQIQRIEALVRGLSSLQSEPESSNRR